MSAPGTIYFRADHDLVGRTIAAKLKERATPLPDQSELAVAEEIQADEDEEREAKVLEWAGLVYAAEVLGAVSALLFLVAILFALVGPN